MILRKLFRLKKRASCSLVGVAQNKEESRSSDGQGGQYGTVRSEIAYYVPRTLNRIVPAYRTSVQFLKRTIPVTKKGVPYQRTVLYSKS